MPLIHLDVPGGRLQVADDGAGSPIVLLHAGVADLRAWDAMVPPLIAAGYRASAPTPVATARPRPRTSRSRSRPTSSPCSTRWGSAGRPLVGNSRGGMTAVDTAIEFPERVVAVVGVGTGLGGFEAAGRPRRWRSTRSMRRSISPTRSMPTR